MKWSEDFATTTPTSLQCGAVAVAAIFHILERKKKKQVDLCYILIRTIATLNKLSPLQNYENKQKQNKLLISTKY